MTPVLASKRRVLVIGLAALLSCQGGSTAERGVPLTQTRAGAGELPSSQIEPTARPAAPGFRDGDLIFQESTSSQSALVRIVTGSRWTHMGVVFNGADGPNVLEAVSPVRETPLESWIARGRDRVYAVKRLRDADVELSSAELKKMRELGSAWVGRPYDLLFRWDDESLYCSELAYKLFERAAGVRLGKLEKASDMNLQDEAVQREIRKRFAGARFDPNETVVTPDSIFNDDRLVKIEL